MRVDSLKTTMKTLTTSIIAAYNDSLTQNLIPGLFSNKYYFWESGVVIGDLLEYY